MADMVLGALALVVVGVVGFWFYALSHGPDHGKNWPPKEDE